MQNRFSHLCLVLAAKTTHFSSFLTRSLATVSILSIKTAISTLNFGFNLLKEPHNIYIYIYITIILYYIYYYYIYYYYILYIYIYIHSREETCLGLPFQVSTNMSTLYRRFPGECIATFFGTIDPKTANMSQFLQLGPLDFDPDLGYLRYFLGIDSANNHSHISKPHPLNNTDTLGGRFPWPVIQPLLNATCF